MAHFDWRIFVKNADWEVINFLRAELKKRFYTAAHILDRRR